MPMDRDRDTSNQVDDLTLTLSPWFFGFLAPVLVAILLWDSPGYLRAVWISGGVLGCLSAAAILHRRSQIIVQDGVLFSAGWHRKLGSCRSAGVDLARLREVDLGPPLPVRTLEVRDAYGETEAVDLYMYRGWRELVGRIARLSMRGDGDVEMSYETEKRLARFARLEVETGTA